jgi:fucose 4-O-acetylase-like acetyltransferase
LQTTGPPESLPSENCVDVTARRDTIIGKARIGGGRKLVRKTVIDEITTKRIDWVDNMKAIAIFLVVVGHYFTDNTLPARAYIYSFHVHLFFLVAGLLFSQKDQGSLRTVVAKRIRTLAVPYLIFESLKYAFFLLRRQFGRTPDLTIGPLEPLYHIATFQASWFLGVLFVVSVVYYLIAPRIKGYKSFLVLAGVCTGVHYALAAYPQANIHLNLPRCFTAMVFFALGAVGRKHLVSDAPLRFVKRRPYVPVGVLAANITVFCFTYAAYGGSAIDINFSRNYLSFYALSLSGISLIYIACRFIPSNAILRFVGANTILIYLMEAYPPAIIRRFTLQAFGVDNFGSIDLGFACLYAVVSIAILSPIIMLINRFAPWAVGRKPAPRATASTQ